jgi:hypothetical protein
MAKAKKAKLVSFNLPNKVGQLAAASELIAGAKLDITAFYAVDAGANAEFMVFTEKNSKAKKALAALGVEVKEQDAVCVEIPNKPGRFHRVLKKIAEAGINIRLSWATAFSGKTATVVLMTSDDAKTISTVNAKKS